MKHLKKSIFAVCLLTLSLLSCGCDESSKGNMEYAASQIQNKITETEAAKFTEDQVHKMARDIYTAFCVYLTENGIKDIPVPADVAYDDIVDALVSDCGLRQEYKYYGLVVSWEFNPETYASQKVTVTVDGITGMYPDDKYDD